MANPLALLKQSTKASLSSWHPQNGKPENDEPNRNSIPGCRLTGGDAHSSSMNRDGARHCRFCKRKKPHPTPARSKAPFMKRSILLELRSSCHLAQKAETEERPTSSRRSLQNPSNFEARVPKRGAWKLTSVGHEKRPSCEV